MKRKLFALCKCLVVVALFIAIMVASFRQLPDQSPASAKRKMKEFLSLKQTHLGPALADAHGRLVTSQVQTPARFPCFSKILHFVCSTRGKPPSMAMPPSCSMTAIPSAKAKWFFGIFQQINLYWKTISIIWKNGIRSPPKTLGAGRAAVRAAKGTLRSNACSRAGFRGVSANLNALRQLFTVPATAWRYCLYAPRVL